MTIKEAINFVDIARMNYICDPHGCGLEKGKDPCTAFHCDEMHDALVMAIEALKIADRLEQARAEEMAIRICCSKCHHTMCRRNPKYEGEQDLFEVGCDLFRRFMNDAILVFEDIRGDNNG